MPFCAIVVVVVVLCSVPRNVVDCLFLHLLSIVSRSISNPYGYIAHHTLLIYLLLLSICIIFLFLLLYIINLSSSSLLYSSLFFYTHKYFFFRPTSCLEGGVPRLNRSRRLPLSLRNDSSRIFAYIQRIL